MLFDAVCAVLTLFVPLVFAPSDVVWRCLRRLTLFGVFAFAVLIPPGAVCADFMPLGVFYAMWCCFAPFMLFEPF
jgi:hypothetical protein